MAFNYDTSNPGDSSYIADFPQNEREFRTDALGSMDVEHYAETTGFHRQISLPESAAKPVASADHGYLYTKEADGEAELFYEGEDGVEVQLTSGGTASPDKLPLAGGAITGVVTMTDADLIMLGTSVIKLLNGAYLQGRDKDNAAWRDLIGVNGSDEVEVGDADLGADARIYVTDVDGLLVNYGSDKIVWNSGHYASAPLVTELFDSDLIVMPDAAASGTVPHGLGGKPAFWWCELECISAEEGYLAGDCVVHSPGMVDSGTPRGIIVAANATNLLWRKTAAEVSLPQSDGSGNFIIDETKWKFRLQAWSTA
jgi:hypothetical protein